MNKHYKPALFINLLAMLGIWILSPASNPAWLKHAAFISAFVLQAIIFAIFGFKKQDTNKEMYFGLTEKIYTTTLLAASGIYIKGVWLLTPDSHPIWVKHIALGILLLTLTLAFLSYAFKKTEEQPDDRFYANLAKSACSTLLLILLSLIVVSLITFFIPFTLTAGLLMVYAAMMILAFDISFWLFEKRGV